jgi:hypothetical protein
MHPSDKLMEKLLRMAVENGRTFNAAALCKPVARNDDGANAGGAADADPASDDRIDVYGVFDLLDTGATRLEHQQMEDFERMIGEAWESEVGYGKSYEEEQSGKGGVDIERRIGAVTAPPVIARGRIHSDIMCWACGTRAAHDVQLPLDVFSVAYRVQGPAAAISCVKEMAEELVKGNFEHAIKRTACCRFVQCMISQNILSCENYASWVLSSANPRAQLERGTDRKDQGVKFSENVLLLHWLAKQNPPVLTVPEISALFHWVVVNAQFIQEREKRFIATAMAIVESSTFGYKFSNPQSFVDRMASVPRNYVERTFLPHILNTALDAARWKSWGNRLIETAFPKAPDAAFMLMCMDNAASRGNIVVGDRLEHCIPDKAPYKELFTVAGFRDALSKAVKENPTFSLFYASSSPSSSSVTMSKGQTRECTDKLLKLLTGSNKRCYTTANGVKAQKAAPTCGAVQADSGVHTKQRYDGVAEGLMLDGKEKERAVSLFIDVHAVSNSVGFEKLKGTKADKTKSKACACIRPVTEYKPPTLVFTSRKREWAARLNTPTAVHRAKGGL